MLSGTFERTQRPPPRGTGLDTESAGSARVLLVDDHPANLLALEAVLAPLDVRLVCARSGAEAITQVAAAGHEADAFALILLDVHMPDLDGFMTARRIREHDRSRQTPIVFLTAADTSQDDLIKGYEHGAVDFMQKPFHPTVLRLKVDTFLEMHRRAQQLRQQEAALRRREAYRRAEQGKLLDLATDALLVRDLEHRIVYCSQGAEVLFGGSRDEIVGRVSPSLAPEASYPFAEIADGLRARQRWDGEVTHIARDGREVVVASRWVLHPGEDGAAASILEIDTDITERRRAEKVREELIASLARSNQDLDQFAYVASHDLKAPLRGIANLSRWLEEDLGDKLSGETAEQMRLLRGRVHRLEALINGILDYSQAGRRRNRPEDVDVARLVGEVVELLAPNSPRCVIVAAAMPTVHCERVKLQQVFLNLLSNALKHACPDEPRVSIDVRDAGMFWEFAVADNGPGIPGEYQARIWGLFQTLEPRDKVESTGIGLSVIKKIVESHGGRTWVDSTRDAGATFFFTWPKGSTA